MKYFIVDAFTDRLFGGNPAGVVILPEGEDFPSEELMLKTAAELRYSETAFIKILGDDTFSIRYFTPAEEVDLCGHATIASFYVLLKEGIVEAGKTYTNITLAGEIKVLVNEDSILMDMAEPKIYGEIPYGEETETLHRIMGIETVGQGFYSGDVDVYLSPKKVYTGIPDIIMPVADERELEKIAPDFDALTAFSKKHEVAGVHAFTLNSKDGKIHARNFCPLLDIDEEAATGTSNGALAYYLYDYEILEPGVIVEVIQGEKMGRTSKISGQVVLEEGVPIVKVGGSAAILAKGEINI